MDREVTTQDILDARDELGLGSEATLAEIKASYKRLAKRYHPDQNIGNETEANARMQKINEAYKLISRYCENYRFGFDNATVAKNANYFKWWFGRFGAPGTSTAG